MVRKRSRILFSGPLDTTNMLNLGYFGITLGFLFSEGFLFLEGFFLVDGWRRRGHALQITNKKTSALTIKKSFFFVRAVRIFKTIARCSKCDFWNLWKIWDRNRYSKKKLVEKFFVEKKSENFWSKKISSKKIRKLLVEKKKGPKKFDFCRKKIR